MSLVANKIWLSLLVMLFSLTALAHSCHCAANLALGKPYTVSPPPNYPLSAPPDDRTSLTDGRYTVGYFWTQKTTVGWHNARRVEILIDLEKSATVDAIRFNTARNGDAGVRFPLHVAAFVGPDKEHLSYVGDVVDSPDNLPGAYRTKRFELENIGVKGRYVLLEIVPALNGSVFCDEIEVLAGEKEAEGTGTLSVEAARKRAEELRRLSIDKTILLGLLDTLGKANAGKASVAGRLPELKRRLHALSSRDGIEAATEEIFALRAGELRARFPQQEMVLEAVDPWASFSPVSSPTGTTLEKLSLHVPQGGYGHAAFAVTNLADETRHFSVSLNGMPAGGPEITLYQVPFVKSAALEYVADPLVPMNREFSLRPGETRIIFMSVHGRSAGTWKPTLTVTSGIRIVPVPLVCRVPNITLPESLSLNAVNWGYLTFKTISSRQREAVGDLFAHHTKVVVIPPALLQGANQLRPTTADDFTKLGSYLKQHRGATKILLAVAFGGDNHTTAAGISYRDRHWQESFTRWYGRVVRIAAEAGFAEEQIYLYPYDEMEGRQIEDFIELASWAKKAIPTIRFYGTVGAENSERAVPFLDIAQIANDPGVPERFTSGRGELWLYDTKGPAKSLSPYAYYRLMSWKAFLRGYTGVGFWAYADAGWGDDPGTAWDDFDGGQPDYAVIYEGKGSDIISSRRWEAWRMGIEDYELLRLYAAARGENAARGLAAEVLDYPGETGRADNARLRILTELSGSNIN